LLLLRHGRALGAQGRVSVMSKLRIHYQACATANGSRVHLSTGDGNIDDGYTTTVCARLAVHKITKQISRSMLCGACIRTLAFSAKDLTAKELGVRKVVS
jgi:hypothetical protein